MSKRPLAAGVSTRPSSAVSVSTSRSTISTKPAAKASVAPARSRAAVPSARPTNETTAAGSGHAVRNPSEPFGSTRKHIDFNRESEDESEDDSSSMNSQLSAALMQRVLTQHSRTFGASARSSRSNERESIEAGLCNENGHGLAHDDVHNDNEEDEFALFRSNARSPSARSDVSASSNSSNSSTASAKKRFKVIESRYLQSAEKKKRSSSVTQNAENRPKPVDLLRSSSRSRIEVSSQSQGHVRALPQNAAARSSSVTSRSRPESARSSSFSSSLQHEPEMKTPVRLTSAVAMASRVIQDPVPSPAQTPSRRELLEQYRSQKQQQDMLLSTAKKKRPSSASVSVASSSVSVASTPSSVSSASVSSHSSNIANSAKKKFSGLGGYTVSLARTESIDPERVKVLLQERRKQRQALAQAVSSVNSREAAGVSSLSPALGVAGGAVVGGSGASGAFVGHSSLSGSTVGQGVSHTAGTGAANIDSERELVYAEFLQWKFANAKLQHVRQKQVSYVEKLFVGVLQVLMQLRLQVEGARWNHLQQNHISFVNSILSHLQADLEGVESMLAPFHQNFKDLAKAVRATLHRIALRGGLFASPQELLLELQKAEQELHDRLASTGRAQVVVQKLATAVSDLARIGDDESKLIQEIRKEMHRFEAIESRERSVKIQEIQTARIPTWLLPDAPSEPAMSH
ncbi:putative mitochondrial protein [Andalucia godoyi]|uniref:Putative mitochondrial protein n=1 Tax=Andalucia godoyi TaxID=505711 RepID=A0A8K0AHF9_ANDGO|nr:putative mitochondrial protein [Andalucia godoyi]|eukprot:ANDGO_04791.mRNA.1 putative mitochondrial protein